MAIDINELEKLRLKHQVWQDKNFPCKEEGPPFRKQLLWAACGMSEELGELFENSYYRDEYYLVAIADIAIYGFSVVTKAGLTLTFPEIFKSDIDSNPRAGYGEDALVSLIGKINHVILKHDQGIRNVSLQELKPLLHEVYLILEELAYYADKNFTLLVKEVIDKITQRDWIKYPETGREEKLKS